MRPSHLLQVLVFTSLCPTLLAAQADADQFDRWVRPADPIHVMLAASRVYQVAIYEPGATVSVQHDSTPGRTVLALVVGQEGRATITEIYPRRDGPHTLRLVGVYLDSVRVRLGSDSALTQRRAEVSTAPRFSVGIEGDIGAQGGYAAFGPGGPDGGAGVMDLCLSFRYGHRFGGCLGYSREAISGLDNAFGFYFGELRMSLLGDPTRGTPINAGILARLGQGNLSGAEEVVDPSILAAGVWAAWWPKAHPSGRGLSLRASLSLARYGNLRDSMAVDPPPPTPLPGEPSVPTGPTSVPTSGSDVAFRATFGINWHP